MVRQIVLFPIGMWNTHGPGLLRSHSLYPMAVAGARYVGAQTCRAGDSPSRKGRTSSLAVSSPRMDRAPWVGWDFLPPLDHGEGFTYFSWPPLVSCLEGSYFPSLILCPISGSNLMPVRGSVYKSQ